MGQTSDNDPFTSPASLVTSLTDTELDLLARFLGATERWIQDELVIREAGAKDVALAMEGIRDKTYWHYVREQMAWDEAAMVAIHFSGILYQGIVLSAYSIMDRSLHLLLTLYLAEPQRACQGVDKKSKQLDAILKTWGWPTMLRCTHQWHRITQWTKVRHALAHANASLYDNTVVSALRDDLKLQFTETGMGLRDEWEIQLMGEDCVAMFDDIMALFRWLETQEHEHGTRTTQEGE